MIDLYNFIYLKPLDKPLNKEPILECSIACKNTQGKYSNNKYLVVPIYIFRLILNLTDIITMMFYYSANEILRRFIQCVQCERKRFLWQVFGYFHEPMHVIP